MAAGIGSRFGTGIKQLEPVDASNHIIMDYSIHDAIEAGFNGILLLDEFETAIHTSAMQNMATASIHFILIHLKVLLVSKKCRILWYLSVNPLQNSQGKKFLNALIIVRELTDFRNQMFLNSF